VAKEMFRNYEKARRGTKCLVHLLQLCLQIEKHIKKEGSLFVQYGNCIAKINSF